MIQDTPGHIMTMRYDMARDLFTCVSLSMRGRGLFKPPC